MCTLLKLCVRWAAALDHLLCRILNRSFAATIPRPFTVRYNAYTQSVEVLNSKEQILNLTHAIKGKMI